MQSLISLAYLHDKLGNSKAAFRWFTKVVEGFPIHTGARFRLAELCEDAGNIEQALEHYNVVAAHEPTKVDPLLRAANAANRAGLLSRTVPTVLARMPVAPV
eukprot:m.1198106 g.1198106  ORF g.1198106 m.1198106 type:complete len:102 (+) comp24569_c0_seq22:327-632(+)